MSELGKAAGVDPYLSRMPSADIAMMKAKASGQLTPQKLQQIKDAADDFEAMFVSEMLSNMSDTVETDPLFGGGEAEETWKGMMNQEIGKEVVKSGGIGLSKDIMTKMIEMQSTADAANGVSAPDTAASAPLPLALQKYMNVEGGL